eukprot:TRINITY_DN7573_c2_g1_i3.p1 TRINITY_DN7573_c2_g1~~TRINITY_DN7573_c2_g1_i3.p1  ORF type:complete len:295 (+),score=41.13 TRINITY_DN7573_c2_g1_i3:144-1028(+)
MIQEYEDLADEGGRATALISFWGNLNGNNKKSIKKQFGKNPGGCNVGGWALQENIYQNNNKNQQLFNRQNNNSKLQGSSFDRSQKFQKVPLNQIQNEIQVRKNQYEKIASNKKITNSKQFRYKTDENQGKYKENIRQKINCKENKEGENSFEENQEKQGQNQDNFCNVQKLVSLFENKSVIDRTQSETEKYGCKKGAQLKRVLSTFSDWSCVGAKYQQYKQQICNTEDTRSVSSVGSNRCNSRYEVSSTWECEGQSQVSDRSESYQVLVTRYANGGIEGVVIQNDFSTFSETSS